MGAPAAGAPMHEASPGAPGAPARTHMPLGDWQFWAASVIAVVAVGFLLRKALPIRALRGRGARRPSRRATLTVGGKPVGSQKPSR